MSKKHFGKLIELKGHSLDNGVFSRVGYLVDSTPHTIIISANIVEGKPTTKSPVSKADIKTAKFITARKVLDTYDIAAL